MCRSLLGLVSRVTPQCAAWMIATLLCNPSNLNPKPSLQASNQKSRVFAQPSSRVFGGPKKRTIFFSKIFVTTFHFQSHARSRNTAPAMQIQLLSTYHVQFGWQAQYFLNLYSNQSRNSSRHDAEALYENERFVMAKPGFASLPRIKHRVRRGPESGQEAQMLT